MNDKYPIVFEWYTAHHTECCSYLTATLICSSVIPFISTDTVVDTSLFSSILTYINIPSHVLSGIAIMKQILCYPETPVTFVECNHLRISVKLSILYYWIIYSCTVNDNTPNETSYYICRYNLKVEHYAYIKKTYKEYRLLI